MTRRSDYPSGTGMNGMESGIEVAEFLAELRSMGDEAPPFPSAELAALLVGGIPISGAPSAAHGLDPARRLAHALVAAAVALVIGLTALNVVAPSSAQQFVSRVETVLKPMHVNPAIPTRAPAHLQPAPSK
jgi:hypothetical protein